MSKPIRDEFIRRAMVQGENRATAEAEFDALDRVGHDLQGREYAMVAVVNAMTISSALAGSNPVESLLVACAVLDILGCTEEEIEQTVKTVWAMEEAARSAG